MRIGTVVAIRRYPVKSMRAEAMDRADLHWVGLHGDRQYAFHKLADRSHFPWLTGRDLADLVLYRARYAEGGDPKHAALRVTAPDGTEYAVQDPALAERLGVAAAAAVGLLRIGRGVFDAMPVSVLTTTTPEIIGQVHGAPVGLDRFRANLVIHPTDPAMTERDWMGRSLAFGDGEASPRLRLDWGIPRCAMVTLDPDTAQRDPSVLRTVAQRFGNQVGAYCAVETPGRIAVGDAVRLTQAGVV